MSATNHMETPPKPRWLDLFRPGLLLPTSTVCLGVVLHAADSLIVSTVMPSAVADIGGATLISWTLTVYVVASVMGALAGGQARARFGARNAYLLGTGLFALGTLICTLAPDMPSFIAGRGVQGLGGGQIAALGYGIIRRVFPQTLWPLMFAMTSGMWGLAALVGPLIGGVFAELQVWRLSFGSIVGLSAALALMAWWALPPETRRKPDGAYPLLRLLVMGASALSVSLAGNATDGTMTAGLTVLSVALAAWVIRADRGAAVPLLPRGSLDIATVTGAGVWMLFLLSLATYSFALYGPYLLQFLHGMSPLQSGYMVAWEAMSWTLVALAVSRWPMHRDRWPILAGPPMVGLGLAGIAWTLPVGPLAWLAVAVFFAGAGMGVCWAFICSRILAAARTGEEDIVGSAVSTVQMMGIAYGAALTGLIANSAGFADTMSLDTGRSVALYIHLSFLAAAFLAGYCAVRLVRARA